MCDSESCWKSCFGMIFWKSHVNYSGHVRPRQGTEIRNFREVSPLDFKIFSPVHFFSSRITPKRNTPGFPGGEKSAESCHVSGCHDFFDLKLHDEMFSELYLQHFPAGVYNFTRPPSFIHAWSFQQTRVYPHPLGAGSARPNPKMGAPDPENPLFLGFSVPRGGLRTVVSDHCLGRGQTMG